jgi:hypothetical protein
MRSAVGDDIKNAACRLPPCTCGGGGSSSSGSSVVGSRGGGSWRWIAAPQLPSDFLGFNTAFYIDYCKTNTVKVVIKNKMKSN